MNTNLLHRRNNRRQDGPPDLLNQARGNSRNRRETAHSPGVRTRITVRQGLVVLENRGQPLDLALRHGGHHVQDARRDRAGQPPRRFRLPLVPCDGRTFTRRESVGLDHPWRAEPVKRTNRLTLAGEHLPPRSGNMELCAEVLGEALRCLDPRRVL